ncbi:MAG: metallophosphoesterase family protein [Candidatus Bathyarchaeia archaeon]
MIIAVISDIHSNLTAFEAVIGKLPKHDALFCLGDIVGYGPQPNEVVARLVELRPSVILMGNHDYAVVSGDVQGFSANAATAVEWTRQKLDRVSRDYLAALKPSTRIEREGCTFALFHGGPRDPLNEYVFPGISDSAGRSLVQAASARIVLLGHTHMPMLYSFKDSVLANPGSVGQPRDGDRRASFALLTLSQEDVKFEIQRVEYDVEPVADRILRSGLPSFLAERLYMGV